MENKNLISLKVFNWIVSTAFVPQSLIILKTSFDAEKYIPVCKDSSVKNYLYF